MTLPSRLAASLRSRRLRLVWMIPRDRNLARLGVAGTVAAGAGVVAAGVGEPVRSVVTVNGPDVVVSDWVALLTYLGLALAAALLLPLATRGKETRIVVGVVLVAMAVAQIESAFRPLEASLGQFGLVFILARALSWVALAAGLAVAFVSLDGATRRVSRLTAVGIGGFGALLASYLLGLAGSASLLPDTVRAALTNGLWLTAINLSPWLVLFAVWQIVEGLHAAVDTGEVGARRFRGRWLLWLVAGKLALVGLGFAFLPPDVFTDWERVRAGGPLGWAYAIVVAAAIMTWLRHPVGPPVSRRAVVVAGLGVAIVFHSPFLIGFTLSLMGNFALLAIPSSVADLVSFLLVGALLVVASMWIKGERRLPIGWRVATLGLVAAVITIPQTIELGGWLDRVESVTTARVVQIGEWLIDVAAAWQTSALALLVVAALSWVLKSERFKPEAMALLFVGIWVFPHAVSLFITEVLEIETDVSVSPGLLTLDTAVTLVAGAVLAMSWLRNRRPPVHVGAIGIVVLVLTTVTYGIQIGGPLVEWLVARAGSLFEVETAALTFVLSLVVPALFLFVFDAAEFNKLQSTDYVMRMVGLSILALTLAVVLIATGSLNGDDPSDDEILRVLVLPGLAVASALALTRTGETSAVGAADQNGSANLTS